jgi:hypothetical protein
MTLPQQSQKHHQAYKQMLPPSSQDSQLPRARHDHHARSNRKPRSRSHQTLPLERTKTLTTVTTNVPSAPRRSRGVHAASGRAGHAGPCSTWAVSRSGPPTRDQWLRDNKLKMEKCLLRGNGAALVAICPRTFCPRTSTAGVRRNRILGQRLAYRPSRVVRPAPDRVSFPRSAHTPVARRAMPAPARLVA